MSKKIILVAGLLAFTAAFMFESAPRSSAQIANGLGVNSPTTSVDTKGSRFKFAPFTWQTIVNNSFYIPGSALTFSSYGQPSVNTRGVVAFRARSTGSSDRQSGIYMRQDLSSPVQDVADLDFFVPFPNNLNTQFTEFPSIPRISMNATNIATRGNHQPVYKYFLPDGTETRAGTTGIYAKLNNSDSSVLRTGASKLGVVPEFKYYGVPFTNPRIAFSGFPGSPAINDQGTIAFKGNYTENGVGKTGIFLRQLQDTLGGGYGMATKIATSDTEIPNAPPSFQAVTFGSTAPPTIAGDQLVFVGLDYEDNPYNGGIYLSPLTAAKPLKTLIGIGEKVDGLRHSPGIPEVPEIKRLGEGLSFDGRLVAFWGAWGTQTRTIRLNCPVDGNRDLIAYCNGVDPNSILDPVTQTWYQLKQVHVGQGIFVMDTMTNQSHLVANSTTDFTDFLFWVYSGKPPGTGDGDEDAEPPRWRQSAFLSVYDGLIAIKARTASLNSQNEYVNIVDGLYIKNIANDGDLKTIIETGMDGSIFDPILAPNDMRVVGFGIEREGLRGRNLAITVSMANEEESWGGIYIASVP